MALVGADGAGKTTVARRLEQSFPRPVKYLYMGVNSEASNVLLPTTRLLDALRRKRGGAHQGGPPDPSRRTPAPKGKVKRALRTTRSMLRLANRLAEEWFRQALAWYHLRRGRIVVFDRHFYSDYYAHDVAANGPRSLDRRVHGLMLKHLYPKPDLVVLLDAPAEVLWGRKQEGTFQALVKRREEYLRLGDMIKDFAIVDATQPRDQVVGEISSLILERCGPKARG